MLFLHVLDLKNYLGSRNVVTLLNRYGHCASNETIRQVDMGLEEGIIKDHSSSYVSIGILKVKGLCTGLAWDNFDLNIQTFSGLDTIHHTYGICYQNIPSEIHEVVTQMTAETTG